MKTLFLITSIIDPPDKNLSYGIRSLFSKAQRFEQTKITIQSIKKMVPHSIIFIVECSLLTEEEEDYFKTNSNYFLNLFNDEIKRTYIYSESKAICEGTQTISGIEYILNNNLVFDHLIKISGRYLLSPEFDISLFLNDFIVIKYVNKEQNNVLTVLFKIPSKYVKELFLFLRDKIKDLIENNEIGYYELLFGEYLNLTRCNKKILDTIGVEGYISVYPEYYKG